MKVKKPQLYTQILQITTVENGIELHLTTRNDQMDIFQIQTSAQLILARAASRVRKGSKPAKVLVVVTCWHVVTPAPLGKIKSCVELRQ